MSRTPKDAGVLGEAVETFVLSMRAEGKSAKTIRTYSEAAVWLAQQVAGNSATSWLDVTTDDVRRHLAWLGEHYSPAYVSNQYRALQAWFKWLAEEEDVPNPMAKMKPPPVPQKLVPVLADGEMDKLLATITGSTLYDVRDRAIFAMFASTGARLAEIAGLRITDLDLASCQAIVTGKGSRMRIIRFDAEAAVGLHRYMRARKKIKQDMLWVGKRGPLTPTGIYQMMRRRAARAGLKVNPHRFRHNFSHVYLRNGGQESDLMQQAGWNSPAMVRRYGASAAAERARANYDKVMGHGRKTG